MSDPRTDAAWHAELKAKNPLVYLDVRNDDDMKELLYLVKNGLSVLDVWFRDHPLPEQDPDNDPITDEYGEIIGHDAECIADAQSTINDIINLVERYGPLVAGIKCTECCAIIEGAQGFSRTYRCPTCSQHPPLTFEEKLKTLNAEATAVRETHLEELKKAQLAANTGDGDQV